MAATKPFIGLLGAGYWGKNLLRDLKRLGCLAMACDSSPTIEAQRRKEYPDLDFTRDFKVMLNKQAVTAIVIALPAEYHYRFAKQCLLAGKDVFVEKPLALKVSDAEELCALAKKKKRILMVGHLLHYHPCVHKIKELLKGGTIGKLRYIHCIRKNLGKIRQQENVLWSFAPHDISVVLALMSQARPIKTICVGQKHVHPDIHDVTDTFLEFPGNCFAHIAVNWLYPAKEQEIHLVGTRGMISFNDRLPVGQKLRIKLDYLTQIPGSVPVAQKKNFRNIKCDWSMGDSPLYIECLHFVRCCQDRVTPITDGEEGLRVLRILDACQQQLTGKKVTEKKRREEKKDYFSHSSAVIHKEAKIGTGSKIWHFTHVMKAKIGKNCSIGQNCFLANDAVLGDNCRVQNNVSVYTGVKCGKNVFLGPSMVFCNDNNPRAAFTKNGNYLDTIVEDGVSIGSNATIKPGIRLGKYCFIGAGAVVTKNVPPYALMVGNPARQMGFMTKDGTRVSERPEE